MRPTLNSEIYEVRLPHFSSAFWSSVASSTAPAGVG